MDKKFSRDIAKQVLFKNKENLTKKDFLSSTYSVFVGRYGYPKLNVGILSPVGIKSDAFIYDAPGYWAVNNFSIPKIVDYRSALINSRFSVHAQDSNKMLDLAKEVGMSSKPVDIELNLEEKPKFRLQQDSINTLIGPNANLSNAKLTSNPKIHNKVDKVVSDDELKANDALLYLYKNHFDENTLSKIMSVGSVGLKKNRKLVPTRWSITSIDSQIGNHLATKIKDYNSTEYLAYFGGYLGNYYLVLCFPDIWNFELFEMGVPLQVNPWSKNKKFYATDYEGISGRSTYAQETAGGYYASRLGVLEKLNEIKKQSTVLVFRFITNEYEMPLGVWVVREATRKALFAKPLEFSCKELMIKYAKAFVNKKFGFDLGKVLNDSKIINTIKNQSKLNQFF
jgi:DNA repair protein NreA